MDTANKLAEEAEIIHKVCCYMGWGNEGDRVVTDHSGKVVAQEVIGIWEAALYDAAQATQAVSEPVATQPAEAVAEFNNGSWRLRIGSVYMTAPNPPAGPWMVNEEHQAKMYAARINAEIAGGVAAFGCDVEASGDSTRGRNGRRCQSWCGLAKCAMSLRSVIVTHPAPASASEPACKTCGGKRLVPDGYLYGEGGVEFSEPIACTKDCPDCASASVAGAGEALDDAIEEIAFEVGLTSGRDQLDPMGLEFGRRCAALAARPVADGEAASLPDAFWEALQRLIENAVVQGPASVDDARLVGRYRDQLAALARQAPAPLSQAVPEGFWLAPVEPTTEMLDRGHHQIDFDRSQQNTEPLVHESHLDELGCGTTIEQDMRDAWAAMRDSWLSRHPQPQAATEDARDGERPKP